MIPVITNTFSQLLKHNRLIAVIIIMILSAIFVLQHKQLTNKNKEIERLQNNCEYYQQQANEYLQNNKVLKLNIDEYKHSNDSLINQIRQQQKKLDIKDKEIKQVQVQEQNIKVDTTVIVNNCDFKQEIKPNRFTSIIINKTDSVLNLKLDIKNTQTLFIVNRKQYKRKYKNWFSRLLHLDFKKQTNTDYQIINNNDIIHSTKTNIIEINN